MALEDFTTYTEFDSGNYLSETTSRVTVVNLPNPQESYLYYDYTADHFDALDINFELYTNDMGGNYYGIAGMGISNTLADITEWTTAGLSVMGQDRNGSFWLRFIRGNFIAEDRWEAGSLDTLYFLRLERAAGNDTATLKIYLSSADRTADNNRQTTLTLSGFGTAKWRYSMGLVNAYDSTGSRLWSGYVQNLEFQGPAIFTESITEVLSLSDVLVRKVNLNRQFVEIITLVENFTYKLFPWRVLISETITLVESFTKKANFKKVLSEILGVDDKMGYYGQALQFNGASDYVDCRDDSSLSITDAITVEAWIYWKEYTASSAIVSKYSQTYILGYQPSDDGKLHWHIYTDAWAILSVSVPKNEWHHLVGTYDKNLGSNQMKIYLDGEFIGEVTQTGSIDTQVGNLGIGIYYIGKPAPLYFNGLIDEVRIYNRALSVNEVLQHYKGIFQDETGLVGHWTFNEGVGSIAHDTSGQGNDGTIYGAKWSFIGILLNRIATIKKSISEVISLVDSVSRKINIKKVLSETITLIESFTKRAIFKKVFSETISLVDTVVRKVGLRIFLSEVVRLVESFNIKRRIWTFLSKSAPPTWTNKSKSSVPTWNWRKKNE